MGKGEGERRTRERSDEKRENAAARVSRKFHYFTLFPSWSTTLFTAFISFSPLHLKSSNIADLSSYNAYTRMIMRMMNAIVRQITMNINFCEQNTESCRHSSMFTHRSRVEERERQRERVVERKRFVYVLLQPREKKGEKNHINLAIEPYTKLYVYPCILLLNWKNEKKIANSPFSFSLFSLSLSISICLSLSRDAKNFEIPNNRFFSFLYSFFTILDEIKLSFTMFY